MYDNYSMPDPRFYKLYANKFRDMHSLRTEDIEGAQPKKQTYDRNDFLNRYYDKVVNHNQVVQSNGPKNLNYWSLPQQDANSSPVRQKGGMSYNGSNAQISYSKPEDYHLPNNYKIPARQNPPQMSQYPGGQYQQQQQIPPQQYSGGNQGYSNNNSAIRNPMYSDFDYNNRQQTNTQTQYQNSPQRTASKGGNNNIYVRDSLDALQMQYGGNNSSYQGSPQYPPQNQNQNTQAEQNFKQDWLNFYGVDSAPAQKQQNTVRQNPAPVKQQDPTIKANAAKFYGEGPSEEDQYEKNLHAFYGADNSMPVRNAKGGFGGAHSNALKKGAKLYNPLIHAPMLHYSKDPSKFEKPKVKDVREQWQFKQNLQKFFDV